MRLEHHLVGGYVRYISPHIIIIIIIFGLFENASVSFFGKISIDIQCITCRRTAALSDIL